MLIRCICPLIMAAMLTACIATQPRLVKIEEPFDAAEAATMIAPGPNTIVGGALMRQRGGGIVTCAGYKVYLVPATAYAKRRMASIYGSGNLATEIVKFQPDIPEYTDLVRTATCNVQGQFTFADVANGDFFLTTKVVWSIADRSQGGALAGRVRVHGGERKEITLAP